MSDDPRRRPVQLRTSGPVRLVGHGNRRGRMQGKRMDPGDRWIEKGSRDPSLPSRAQDIDRYASIVLADLS
jgi:hypothetical protein